MLTAVLLVFALNAANNRLARSRAETLIAAIKAFNQRNQRYPIKLNELVPDFIDHVPVAKYIINPLFGLFRYTATTKYHRLSYYDSPPFGRPIYQFEEDRWSYLE